MEKESKILYLVRHAKSSWKEAEQADIDRPLNKRGLANAPAMGERLYLQGHKPDLIISSPAARALSTARCIAGELNIDSSEIVTNDSLYFSGSLGTQYCLQSIDDEYREVMIVGHNPTTTSLANQLADAGIVNMPTCAIAIIGFEMASWADLSLTPGRLLGYDYPKGSGEFRL
ncbi:MAG: histidine phosphatase family protein [Halieaceae bacterium]|jgi:phosphohistidine phosphatase|nr:histidine phosphatase family protein [Halieaceae bacterium]